MRYAIIGSTLAILVSSSILGCSGVGPEEAGLGSESEALAQSIVVGIEKDGTLEVSLAALSKLGLTKQDAVSTGMSIMDGHGNRHYLKPAWVADGTVGLSTDAILTILELKEFDALASASYVKPPSGTGGTHVVYTTVNLPFFYIPPQH